MAQCTIQSVSPNYQQPGHLTLTLKGGDNEFHTLVMPADANHQKDAEGHVLKDAEGAPLPVHVEGGTYELAEDDPYLVK